jgi:hypothetical protein
MMAIAGGITLCRAPRGACRSDRRFIRLVFPYEIESVQLG